MNELLEYYKQGYNVVVDADIKGFWHYGCSILAPSGVEKELRG
jgi:hypothetical protein